MSTLDLFHCSDVHFGHPAVPEQYEAIETLLHEKKYDVTAVSGDLTQRARSGEFQRARAFLKHAERVSKVVVVPGNHDVKWWLSPFRLGDDKNLLRLYREYINEDIEPVLRLPGATIVGINTCHGVIHETLTWNMRDLSVIGYVRDEQIDRAAREFAQAPRDAARIIVMHHNPVKGELSGRHGLRNTRKVIAAFERLAVDVVCCGHDHQEAVHYIEHTNRGTIISTAGTISNRQRGGRPSSVNTIHITDTQIEVHTLLWSDEKRTFIPSFDKCFDR